MSLDEQPPSDVLLGSSSSNDENVEIHDDVDIESDVSQDSEAETEEMSEVVTIMGQSFDYDSSAEDLELHGSYSIPLLITVISGLSPF